jgi:hypothetical protein
MVATGHDLQPVTERFVAISGEERASVRREVFSNVDAVTDGDLSSKPSFNPTIPNFTMNSDHALSGS